MNIAVSTRFADEVSRALTFPHRLATYGDGDGDERIGRLLAASDALVSPRFKTAWRAPEGSALKLVHSTGAGTDGIEVAGLPSGCRVCNVYGHERGVAEHAFLLMAALQRNLMALDRSLRRGNWSLRPFYVPELRGRNLLIVGLGHIGRELVRWGRFLEMDIRAVTRRPSPDRAQAAGLASVGSFGELETLLPWADFIVVAVPAAAGSLGLIGGKEFARMKPTAFLVNVGRGPVVDEAALYEALRSRRIAGAGLDVWYRYPQGDEPCLPSQFPFQELDNVIMTPHKPTLETMAFRWKVIAENLRRLSRGEPLENIVLSVP